MTHDGGEDVSEPTFGVEAASGHVFLKTSRIAVLTTQYSESFLSGEVAEDQAKARRACLLHPRLMDYVVDKD